MLTLVLGGSASGKSEYAENVIRKMDIETKIYLATMQPYDEEMEKRIEKHRMQRRDKGFYTIEKYRDISEIKVSPESVILLECMSNLLANEFYYEHVVTELVEEKIVTDIEKLLGKCKHLIIVSNDVFHDGCEYPEETRKYIEVLGRINQRLSQKANQVTEVVCGIPLTIKETI